MPARSRLAGRVMCLTFVAHGTHCECEDVGVTDWLLTLGSWQGALRATHVCTQGVWHAHAQHSTVSSLWLYTPRCTALQAATSSLAGGPPCGALPRGQAGPGATPMGPTESAARQERALGMLAARLGRAAPAGAAAGAAELVFPWLLAAAAAAERQTRAAALAALRAVQVRMRGGACRARGGC